MVTTNYQTGETKCVDCGFMLNLSVFSPEQAIAQWDEKHHCIDKKFTPEKLATTLSILQAHNVGGVEFFPNGVPKVVNFRFDYRMKEAPITANAAMPPLSAHDGGAHDEDIPLLQRRETDIDLALNPPDDVKHPVDDGT